MDTTNLTDLSGAMNQLMAAGGFLLAAITMVLFSVRIAAAHTHASVARIPQQRPASTVSARMAALNRMYAEGTMSEWEYRRYVSEL